MNAVKFVWGRFQLETISTIHWDDYPAPSFWTMRMFPGFWCHHHQQSHVPCLEFTPARDILQCLPLPLPLAQLPSNSPWLCLRLLLDSVKSFAIFSLATVNVSICQRLPQLSLFSLSLSGPPKIHTYMPQEKTKRVKVQEDAEILGGSGLRLTTSTNSAFLWVNYKWHLSCCKVGTL